MEYHNNIVEIPILDKNILKSNNENLILKKKKLIELSKNLTKIEYFEIFNIINEDNCQYSENKNGIFINLLNVSENTIDKIFEFINFIKHKKEDLIKHEEYLVFFKKNITDNIIENKIDPKNNYPLEINKQINNKELSDNDEEYNENKNDNYLLFSSDEDDDLENKILLKKKKNKYSGKKAKIIKSIKDNNDINKQKINLKK
jgi:hypothetical protein